MSEAATAVPSVQEEAKKTRKGEQTRAQILETALTLFRERGYEDTTMRAIAEAAGVSVGNAYYYFRSKEHLIQAFYARTHQEHLDASRDILAREKSLKGRFLGVMQAKLDTIMPYHRFAGILFKTAADPASPLHPFSDESGPVRQESTDLFAEAIAGADVRLHPELMAELPNLLWVYHMGIILFWIHDPSPGCARSYRLMEQSVKLITRLISLAQLPVLRPLFRELFKLAAEMRTGVAAGTAEAGT
jgi:AcrR family transcriptional regulator